MFSQAMKHEKPTNVRLGNPRFRGWFGLGQLQILGTEIALHVVSCKVQLPIKDMGHSPHTSGSLSPNNFSGSIIGVTRIIIRR